MLPLCVNDLQQPIQMRRTTITFPNADSAISQNLVSAVTGRIRKRTVLDGLDAQLTVSCGDEFIAAIHDFIVGDDASETTIKGVNVTSITSQVQVMLEVTAVVIATRNGESLIDASDTVTQAQMKVHAGYHLS